MFSSAGAAMVGQSCATPRKPERHHRLQSSVGLDLAGEPLQVLPRCRASLGHGDRQVPSPQRPSSTSRTSHAIRHFVEGCPFGGGKCRPVHRESSMARARSRFATGTTVACRSTRPSVACDVPRSRRHARRRDQSPVAFMVEVDGNQVAKLQTYQSRSEVHVTRAALRSRW